MLTRSLQIIYASTSGNTLAVAEYLHNMVLSSGMYSEIHKAQLATSATLNLSDTFVFATSTWEHGEINPYFKPLMKEIREKDLSEKRVAFIGTGDVRYEPVLFCQGMETLRELILSRGGKEICDSLKINGDPYDHMDSAIKNWCTELIQLLQSDQV